MTRRSVACCPEEEPRIFRMLDLIFREVQGRLWPILANPFLANPFLCCGCCWCGLLLLWLLWLFLVVVGLDTPLDHPAPDPSPCAGPPCAGPPNFFHLPPHFFLLSLGGVLVEFW